jgi:hypothetical protein
MLVDPVADRSARSSHDALVLMMIPVYQIILSRHKTQPHWSPQKVGQRRPCCSYIGLRDDQTAKGPRSGPFFPVEGATGPSVRDQLGDRQSKDRASGPWIGWVYD